MANARTTIGLLQQMLPSVGAMYQRLLYSRPWCFMTMGGLIMLIRIHIEESSVQAQEDSTKQLLNMHHEQARHRLLGYDQACGPMQNTQGYVRLEIFGATFRMSRSRTV
jgi:hypothetical protein